MSLSCILATVVLKCIYRLMHTLESDLQYVKKEDTCVEDDDCIVCTTIARLVDDVDDDVHARRATAVLFMKSLLIFQANTTTEERHTAAVNAALECVYKIATEVQIFLVQHRFK